MRASLRRGLIPVLALASLASLASLAPGASAAPSPLPADSGAVAPRSSAVAAAIASALVPSAPPDLPPGDAGSDSAPPLAPPSASVEPPPPSAAPVISTSAPAPVAEPAPSASGGVESAGVPVRLRDMRVFSILVASDGYSAEERAEAASAALKRIVDDGLDAEVQVKQTGDRVSIVVGPRLVVELGPEDAIAAHDRSLEVHAERVASIVREALERERSRSATLLTLLSLLLVLLCAVVGIFLIRKASDLADRTRAWLHDNPDRLPAIKLQSIEVIRPQSLRAALLIGLGAGKALAQIGVVYGWILITLFLFDATRGYAERLTGFVFGPLSSILARFVGSLPLLVVAAIAAIAAVVLVRFVGLFFDGVARGETTVDWLPADLAAPTSVLVRAMIVLSFFVIAAPLVTGDDGALARAGTVVVVSIGLSATPLLACVAVGVTVVYGRGLHVGDFAEVGGRAGKVSAITLLDVRLEDDLGAEVRIPHLLGLVHPTRVLGPARLVSVELLVALGAAVEDNVRNLLAASASAVGNRPQVEIVSLDADGVRYRVTVSAEARDAKSRLFTHLAQTLRAAEVPLGRRSAARAGE